MRSGTSKSHVVPSSRCPSSSRGGRRRRTRKARPGRRADGTARLPTRAQAPTPPRVHERLRRQGDRAVLSRPGRIQLGGTLKTLTRRAERRLRAVLRLALAEAALPRHGHLSASAPRPWRALRYQDEGSRRRRRRCAFFAEAFPGHPLRNPDGAGHAGTLPGISAATTSWRSTRGPGRAGAAARRRRRRAIRARTRWRGAASTTPSADCRRRRSSVATRRVSLSGIGDRHVVEVDVPQSVIRFCV